MHQSICSIHVIKFTHPLSQQAKGHPHISIYARVTMCPKIAPVFRTPCSEQPIHLDTDVQRHKYSKLHVCIATYQDPFCPSQLGCVLIFLPSAISWVERPEATRRNSTSLSSLAGKKKVVCTPKVCRGSSEKFIPAASSLPYIAFLSWDLSWNLSF